MKLIRRIFNGLDTLFGVGLIIFFIVALFIWWEGSTDCEEAKCSAGKKPVYLGTTCYCLEEAP